MKTTERRTTSGTAAQFGRSQHWLRMAGRDSNMIRTLSAAAVAAVAAGGLALGFAGIGMFAGAGTAAADGHNIVDEDGTWGAPDGAEQRGASMRPAVHAIDASATIIPAWPATPTWPAPPSWGSYPQPASYPAAPSWPGNGWGVADN